MDALYHAFLRVGEHLNKRASKEICIVLGSTELKCTTYFLLALVFKCSPTLTHSQLRNALNPLTPPHSTSSFIFAALNSIPPLAPKPVVKWSLRSSQPCIPPPASAKKFRGSSSLIDRGKSDKWVDLVLTISDHIICNEYFKIVQIYYSFCQFCK